MPQLIQLKVNFFKKLKFKMAANFGKARDSPEIMRFPNFELLCDSKL